MSFIWRQEEEDGDSFLLLLSKQAYIYPLMSHLILKLFFPRFWVDLKNKTIFVNFFVDLFPYVVHSGAEMDLQTLKTYIKCGAHSIYVFNFFT